MSDAWCDDLLGHKEIGETFTRLVKSIDPEKEQSSKVISIEAGFGWGKTFFRTEWAKHLKAEGEGEVVIQIDAQKSDHSGDPVVTFLGALIAALPEAQRGFWTKALGTGKKALWGTAKIAATMAARKAGEDAADALEGWFSGDEDGPLEEALKDFSKHASKGLGQQVVAQIAAEHAREREIPKQLEALRNALTEGRETSRVIILIDELDRCHPDYVISLLEALKLVFGEPGFVFVLMVNDHHLQALAEHRFGKVEGSERYLDKFVDLRLKLAPSAEALGQAAALLVAGDPERGVQGLPDYTPFGDDREFSKERAAELIAQIVQENGPEKITMRQIKRLVERLELVLRCYPKTPIDLPLLVWLCLDQRMERDGNRSGAFNKEKEPKPDETRLAESWLPRAKLTPNVGSKVRRAMAATRENQGLIRMKGPEEIAREICGDFLPTMASLPEERFGRAANTKFHLWKKVCLHLSEHYIPSHQAMLVHVHGFQADD